MRIERIKALFEGIRLSRLREEMIHVAVDLQHFALIGALDKQTKTAACLIGYVDRQCEQLGVHRESTEQWSYNTLTAVLRENFSPAELARLANEGASWSEDYAIAEALKV